MEAKWFRTMISPFIGILKDYGLNLFDELINFTFPSSISGPSFIPPQIEK